MRIKTIALLSQTVQLSQFWVDTTHSTAVYMWLSDLNTLQEASGYPRHSPSLITMQSYHFVFRTHFLPLTPPDPSLTPDNILKVIHDVPLWGSVESYDYLDMTESLHDEIASKFDGEQAKCELFTTWLAGHSCPTWDHVERLLRRLESEGRGREEAAEEVKETYLKSELTIRACLVPALQEHLSQTGKCSCQMHTCNLHYIGT